MALRNFQGDGAHLFVDEAVGGEDDGAAELVRISGEVGDFAAGLFDEQDAGGGVPGLQAKFPEAVEAAGGDAGEIERGGAIAADSVRALSEFAVVLKIGAGFAVAHGETGAEEAGGNGGYFGDVHSFAVEECAFAAGGGEEFVVEGIENDGGEKFAGLGERNGNAEARVAMGEVGGAVEGIDVPTKFGGGGALVAGALFGGDGVVGKIFGDALDDQFFGAPVGLGDEIDFVAFVAKVQRARQFLDEDFAGFLGDFDGGFEIVSRH